MLTGFEIKNKIDENNKKIEDFFSANTFVLNANINSLIDENRLLRKQCRHEFDENKCCVYCYFKRGE